MSNKLNMEQRRNSINTLRVEFDEHKSQSNRRLNQIEQFNKEVESRRCNLPMYPLSLFLLIVLVAGLFLLGFIWLNKHCGFGISDDGIVITFIGILATFVIISNYAQVSDIKKKVDEKIASIDQINDSINKLESDVKRIDARFNDVKKDAYPHNQLTNINRSMAKLLEGMKKIEQIGKSLG